MLPDQFISQYIMNNLTLHFHSKLTINVPFWSVHFPIVPGILCVDVKSSPGSSLNWSETSENITTYRIIWNLKLFKVFTTIFKDNIFFRYQAWCQTHICILINILWRRKSTSIKDVFGVMVICEYLTYHYLLKHILSNNFCCYFRFMPSNILNMIH